MVLTKSHEPFKSTELFVCLFFWLIREKSGRYAPAGLEESKRSFCELPLGATWQGIMGSSRN